MTRPTRMVEPAVWRLSPILDARRGRLIDVLKPDALLEQVVAEAEAAARNDSIRLAWQGSIEPCRSRYFRVVLQIPLTQVTFDQLFNGRSGYRAQYYLSPEEVILYNRDLLYGLRSSIRSAYRSHKLDVELGFIEDSAGAPHSKIWVYEETT